MQEVRTETHIGDYLKSKTPLIAVLIPCFNEEQTIRTVVKDFQARLPYSDIYVYDNNSTDNTASAAASAGACVRKEARQGKGNVVRRMFADVEADVYLLVDGDDTYEAAAATTLISALLSQELDFVNGARISQAAAYRRGHRLGNYLLTGLVQRIFGRQFDDMLSGYKVFSRRFVKSFPAISSGFEIETELAVHALELRMPCSELVTQYKGRPEGSVSKLRTYHDGIRILLLIMRLVKDERPLSFFSAISLALISLAVLLGVPLLITYLETGLVPRIPTAIIIIGLIILGTLSFFAGLILDMISRTRYELKRLMYLSQNRTHGRQ